MELKTARQKLVDSNQIQSWKVRQSWCFSTHTIMLRKRFIMLTETQAFSRNCKYGAVGTKTRLRCQVQSQATGWLQECTY